MAKRDYYEILGLNRDAPEADIKKAYRRLAMKFHPDRNPDDASAEDKFKEATEAYEILADSEKRAAYDQYGHAGVDPSMGGGFEGTSFSDIFVKPMRSHRWFAVSKMKIFCTSVTRSIR